MKFYRIRCFWTVIALVASMPSGIASAAGKKPPTQEQIVAAASATFEELSGHKPGDLISQSQANAALQAAAKLGWQAGIESRLAGRALPDGHFLIQRKSSRKGRSFLRKVGKSGGYAQLDRLSSTSDGKKHIKYLIGQRDGHLLITYMATTSKGRNLGRQMANVRRGVNLNKPTDRIYTAEQLMVAIKELYRSTASQQASRR